ncbi:MAG: peptidase [Thiotrichaceae bacterium]|nr:MAG: peptidase [Thiotrichaceae bacterium]
MSSQTAKYGNWTSIISSDLIVSDNITIDEPKQHGQSIYYIERRPQENGRCVIVVVNNNTSSDILPPPYSARSRVHEYGGGCYCVNANIVYFVNDSDQDIYCINNNQVKRVTKTNQHRFADLVFDPSRHRLIAVCETHVEQEVTNTLVSIDIDNGSLVTIEQGDDFYASPRLNSTNDQLCWQSWNHPNMPWDGNKLWLARLNTTGKVEDKKHIAGDDNSSVFQPQWSPDDELYFISDKDGWWQLYHHSNTNNTQLTEGEKELGLPQWVFAQSTYAFIDNSRILCCFQSKGQTSLATISLTEPYTLNIISTSWHDFSSITADKGKLCFIAASSSEFPQLISASLDDKTKNTLKTTRIKNSCLLPIDTKYYSNAQSLSFTNRHQQIVYAHYYPPTNPDYTNEKAITANSEKPPLIVICHGGPTGQAGTALDPRKQFWTSRGFALLDVNYSGSTGYGKAYRERLNGKWGILDIEDCCDAAEYAVTSGLADKNQLIIRGSSAGGYTVLSALTFKNVFSAGASYYGISELTSLAEHTHKFESRYLDRLIGPYPEQKSLYEERSPINSTDQLNCPVIFFQGIEDKVVPKQQAEKMFEALDKKGLSVAAQYYEGEQHGFRKANTITQSLENELSFYQLIFKLKPADEIIFKGDIQLKNI